MKLSLRYKKASVQSFGVMLFTSGIKRSHSPLNACCRKSSGQPRTPESSATFSNSSSLTGQPAAIEICIKIIYFHDHLVWFLLGIPTSPLGQTFKKCRVLLFSARLVYIIYHNLPSHIHQEKRICD